MYMSLLGIVFHCDGREGSDHKKRGKMMMSGVRK
jgi:hypothetical protein